MIVLAETYNFAFISRIQASDTDKQSERVERSPFSQSIARRIVEELFGSQPQWKSNDLKERVIQLHRERGGFTHQSPYI
jgi:hypothetical protein